MHRIADEFIGRGPRHRYLVQRWILMLLATAALQVSAQDFPLKPIRLMIGFPPGGGADVVARQFTPKLGELLAQQVVIDSRSGAGGNIALELLARQVADGYTLMLTTPTLTVNPALYPKVGYDPLRDFAPVALVATTVYVLVVHPSLPVKKVSELIMLAKTRPRQLNYSSGGNGAAAHLAGELFRSMAGIQLVHLPYKGVAQALMAVLSGEAPITFASQPTALPLVRADKLRGLGVTGAKRSPFSPDIPSIAEAALPGYETTAWFGIIAPAKTPAAVVAKLNAEVGRALDSAEVKAAMTRQSLEILSGKPEQFATLIRDELVKWHKVVKESGMRID